MGKKYAPAGLVWQELWANFMLNHNTARVTHNAITAVAIDHMVKRIVVFTLVLAL